MPTNGKAHCYFCVSKGRLWKEVIKRHASLWLWGQLDAQTLAEFWVPPIAPPGEVTATLKHSSAACPDHRPPLAPPLGSAVWTGGNFLLWPLAVWKAQLPPSCFLHTLLFINACLWNKKKARYSFHSKADILICSLQLGLLNRILLCVLVCHLPHQ